MFILRMALAPVLAVKDSAQSVFPRLREPDRQARIEALKAAISWLCLSHDVTGRRGSSQGFSLVYGWRPAFPETTGYIIGTLLDFARKTADAAVVCRAKEMADWQIETQLENGAVMEGTVGSRHVRPEVFNTGMAALGLIDTYEALGDPVYLEAAARACGFLKTVQDGDGAWRRASYRGIPHTYQARASWALLRLFERTGDMAARRTAEKNLAWVLSMQSENGWFKACNFKPGQLPNTHGIAYTLRGLLESYAIIGREEYIQAVLKASEPLINKFEELGSLPAVFDEAWKPRATFQCLTGTAQLSIVWLRLYRLTNDSRYLKAGVEAVDRTAVHQQRPGARLITPALLPWAPIRGALPGSFPIYGRYAPLQFPNWATKFLADALMLRNECAPEVPGEAG